MLPFQSDNSLRQGLLDSQRRGAADDPDVRLVIDPLVPPPQSQIPAWHFDELGHWTFRSMTRTDLLVLIREATGDNTTLLMSPIASQPRRPKHSQQHPTSSAVHMRDIRQLDQAFTESSEPCLVLRDQAILVNVDPIRAVVLRNQFVVLGTNRQVDASLMDQLQSRVQTYLRESPTTPFELTALEGLLSIIATWFAHQCTLLKPTAEVALASFAQNDRPRDEFDRLRQVQAAATTLHAQVGGIRRMLMTLLDDEDDLSMLQLTKLFQKVSAEEDLVDLSEVESLLETHLQEIFGTHASISMVLTKIEHTQRMVDLAWTSKRNYLLVVDMSLKCMFLGLLFTHLWTGIFGQNLASHVAEDDVWFTATFGSCGVWIVGSYVFVYLFLKSRNIVLSWRKPGFELPE